MKVHCTGHPSQPPLTASHDGKHQQPSTSASPAPEGVGAFGRRPHPTQLLLQVLPVAGMLLLLLRLLLLPAPIAGRRQGCQAHEQLGGGGRGCPAVPPGPNAIRQQYRQPHGGAAALHCGDLSVAADALLVHLELTGVGGGASGT